MRAEGGGGLRREDRVKRKMEGRFKNLISLREEWSGGDKRSPWNRASGEEGRKGKKVKENVG